MKLGYILSFIIGTLIINSSCQSKKVAPPADAETEKLEDVSLARSKSKPLDLPRAMTPESLPKSADNGPVASGDGALLQAALVGSMTMLGNVLSNDPKRNDLRGRCQYGDPENPAISGPCTRVNVNLLDKDRKIQATTETDIDGQFRFYIPKDQSYVVEVKDRKSRSSVLNKTVGRGDLVSIFLKP